MKRKLHRRFRPREFKSQKSTYLVITETYLIPLIVIFLALASSFLVFKSNLFAVTQIDCQRDGGVCHNDFILAELVKYRQKNIFLFPKAELKQRLLQGDKTLTSVKFTFHLPHQLTVLLTSTTPKVALRLNSANNQFILIDQNFRPTSLVNNPNHLPILTTTQTYHLQLGQTIQNSNLKQALTAAIEFHQNLANQPFKLKLAGQDLYLYLPQKHIQVRLTTQKSLASQLNLLRVVLSDVKMLEAERVRSIDVRFGQPVLKSY